jgi:hypothetical protein
MSILFPIFVGVFVLLDTNPATQINTDPANPNPKPWQSHSFFCHSLEKFKQQIRYFPLLKLFNKKHCFQLESFGNTVFYKAQQGLKSKAP